MAKKKRVWAYTGSLLAPISRYFLNLSVTTNPYDLNGSSIAE